MQSNATEGIRRDDASPRVASLREHVGQIVRFVFVGMGAVVVDFVVYFALSRAIPPSAAKAVSFVSGACVSFLGNRGFVFRAEGRTHKQWMSFVGLYFISLCLNNVVNTGVLKLPIPYTKFLAWFSATGASTILNFLGMKFFVFKRAPYEASSTLAK
ncbi:MAG: GtrA family protein [Polyangiaceae bacterium]